MMTCYIYDYNSLDYTMYSYSDLFTTVGFFFVVVIGS